MKKCYNILLLASLILIGCGRDESAYIINKTGKPIIIKLGLHNITHDPTKYLVADALDGVTSSDYINGSIDNHFISFDSLTNELTLSLDIDENLKLGTVRLDMTRDSIKYWEFNSIKATGEGINIQAQGNEIINLVKRRKSLLTQDSHYLILK